jgi:hypothetical protein
MSANLINKLFEVVVKKFEGMGREKRGSDLLKLPIKKIDGLNVYSTITLIFDGENVYNMSIDIKPTIYYKEQKSLYHLHEFNTKVFDKELKTFDFSSFKKKIERFFEELPKLKINIEGVLSKNGELMCYNSKYKYIDLFIDEKIDGVEFEEYEECCVCGEHTTTKTKCGHILCLKCEDKINEMIKKRPKCPICRQCIENYNESDEEEDDDESDDE